MDQIAICKYFFIKWPNHLFYQTEFDYSNCCPTMTQTYIDALTHLRWSIDAVAESKPKKVNWLDYSWPTMRITTDWKLVLHWTDHSYNNWPNISIITDRMDHSWPVKYVYYNWPIMRIKTGQIFTCNWSKGPDRHSEMLLTKNNDRIHDWR